MWWELVNFDSLVRFAVFFINPWMILIVLTFWQATVWPLWSFWIHAWVGLLTSLNIAFLDLVSCSYLAATTMIRNVTHTEWSLYHFMVSIIWLRCFYHACIHFTSMLLFCAKRFSRIVLLHQSHFWVLLCYFARVNLHQ